MDDDSLMNYQLKNDKNDRTLSYQREEEYIIDGYLFKEFINDGTLMIVAKRWDPKFKVSRDIIFF